MLAEGGVGLLERAPPRFVRAVPFYRRPQPLVERHLGRPAQAAQPLTAEAVAAVVAGAVRDAPDQRLRLPEQAEDVAGQPDVPDLVAPAAVVGLAESALLDEQGDRAAGVVD